MPLPGSGGDISRGPGSVPMQWGDETPDLRAEMRAEALIAPSNPEEAMELLGLTQMAPTVDVQGEGQQTSGPGADTAGEAVWKRRLRPEHRKAVQRYFERSGGN